MQSLQIESDRQQKIQMAAYYLWQQRGSPFGTPELDWFRAEDELERQAEPASTRPVLVTAAETLGSALGSIAGAAASVSGLFHAEATSQSE